MRRRSCGACGTGELVAVAVRTGDGYRTALVEADHAGPKTFDHNTGTLRPVIPIGGRALEAVPHIPQRELFPEHVPTTWKEHECALQRSA